MAMTCDDFQEKASRFMDGMLQASDQVLLFGHLSSCTDCRSFLASSVRAREVIRKDPATVPEGIDEDFFERLSSRHVFQTVTHTRPRPLWQREVMLSFPLAAAALLLVALASALFSVLFMKTGTGATTLETVLGRERASNGRQTVVVVYQMPEEQVITMPSAKMFEVKARTIAD